ncbi:hypothetical protein Cgig2_029935 [Carnegiea gigantea]|uniref:Protein kinase domain-containing protein n=1 Tax=Carnegiea gigantea TaxID=171969 RepID=A0A9Q1GV76_9CARY|nr:hypothetical protein Cgig2_029935 [Carnegiea gigantea]
MLLSKFTDFMKIRTLSTMNNDFGLRSCRYNLLEELGDGTCGTVYRAINMETYEIVAVKKMKRKFYFWEECINLREVKSLCRLSHPNIIKLKEVVGENNELYFIFEYMEHNLYQIMKERQSPFSEEEIKNFLTQVLQGLAHMHRNGYFHRDLKPGKNLLVTDNVIKIGDLGLAREVLSMPPYTDYVSTRWYRAPEILLRSSYYTPAIDMWAVGAILAELFTLCPIFPGEGLKSKLGFMRLATMLHQVLLCLCKLLSVDSEIDQLYKICCVLGVPDWGALPQSKNTAQLINISYSEFLPVNLSEIIPNASWEAIDLISVCAAFVNVSMLAMSFILLHLIIRGPVCGYEPFSQSNSNSVLGIHLRGQQPSRHYSIHSSSNSDDCFLGLTLAVNPSVSNSEMEPRVHGSTGQDTFFYSGFQDHPVQSVPTLPLEFHIQQDLASHRCRQCPRRCSTAITSE